MEFEILDTQDENLEFDLGFEIFVDLSSCPDCPECPECPDCPDCPDCPECPECPECPDQGNDPGSGCNCTEKSAIWTYTNRQLLEGRYKIL